MITMAQAELARFSDRIRFVLDDFDGFAIDAPYDAIVSSLAALAAALALAG